MLILYHICIVMSSPQKEWRVVYILIILFLLVILIMLAGF